MSNLYIGVMSGTSLDGVDIALCEIEKDSCKLLYGDEFYFPKELKEEVLTLLNKETTVQKIGTLNTKLGHLFADAVLVFLDKYKLNAADINAVGLHGQTLWHAPNNEYAFSMQLGCPNVMVAKTQIRTVADFRSMDVANGGQGAPFAPAFHQAVFATLKERAVVLNIGGMANLTFLGEELKGYDSGCGNVLLDYWMSQTQLKPYDKDGEFARGGEINAELLESMLEDEYFKKSAPKSTGREYFNAQWLESYIEKTMTDEPINARNIQRTLLELTAISISNELKDKEIDTLIVCGGGAKNSFLMQRLSELSQCEVKRSDEFGVDGDSLEAQAFAWFAYKRIHKEKVELKSVTGAKKNSVLGAVYEAS